MVSKQTILQKLKGTAPVPRMITKNQSVDDIIRQMETKTADCAGDYDLIYKYFEGGSLHDVCQRLFEWALDNIDVKTETEEKQYVSCPYTILTRGTSDCKGYALFIGGILDAMKRHGRSLDWNYRFTSYNLLDPERHHVFVVVNKRTDDIWIDPVLGEYNYHLGYWYKTDKKPKAAAIGFVGSLNPQTLVNQQLDVNQANISTFTEAGAGAKLPSIAGYPSDLPQLQLSPTGRLCFYSWPEWFTSSEWTDLSTMQPLATKLATGDWTGSWLRLGTYEPITQAQYNELKAGYADGTYAYDWAVYNPSGPKRGYWKFGRPYMWIFQNIQYYINKYLINPYPVTELIPYGTNWADQFKTAIQDGPDKLKKYLSGCSFLVQPKGSKTFWDNFYLAAPLVISAIAAIVTDGAATPALLLALGNLGIKYGEAKAAIDSKTALPQQGTPQENTAAINQDAAVTPVQKITAWIAAHKGISIAAALLLIYLIAEND